jgi:hypothetical protein
MDQAKIVPMIQKRHGFRVSPDDPIWSLGAVAEDLNKETITQIQKMLTEQLDQISASNVQAENAAKARGEKLINEGTAWAAQKIREAGDAAAAKFNSEVEKALADAKKQMDRAIMAIWMAAAAAACAAIGTVAVLWL